MVWERTIKAIREHERIEAKHIGEAIRLAEALRKGKTESKGLKPVK